MRKSIFMLFAFLTFLSCNNDDKSNDSYFNVANDSLLNELKNKNLDEIDTQYFGVSKSEAYSILVSNPERFNYKKVNFDYFYNYQIIKNSKGGKVILKNKEVLSKKFDFYSRNFDGVETFILIRNDDNDTLSKSINNIQSGGSSFFALFNTGTVICSGIASDYSMGILDDTCTIVEDDGFIDFDYFSFAIISNAGGGVDRVDFTALNGYDSLISNGINHSPEGWVGFN